MAASGLECFLGELECPVCLLLPREGPVGACPVGHIVCKTCRENVETCPTCRRPMLKDGTNTIVNKMIGKVPHSCKYNQYGCQIKLLVPELEEHETKCPERTIKCPHIRCNDEVQIMNYYDHALTSTCNIITSYNNENNYTINSKTGESIKSLLSRDRTWRMRGFCDYEETFYFHQLYFSEEKTFAFYVTSTMTDSEAEKYFTKITLKNQNNERKYLANVQTVISMDSAPRDRNEVLASKDVMFVSWRQMSGFLKWTEKDGIHSSRIDSTVEIVDEDE